MKRILVFSLAVISLYLPVYAEEGFPAKMSQDVQETIQKAIDGDVDAMLKASKAFVIGEGVAHSPEAGRMWLEKAVATGDVKAITWKAYALYKGNERAGYQKDRTQAIALLKSLDGKHTAYSASVLGRFLLWEAQTIDQVNEARRYLEKAVNLDPSASNALATLSEIYYEGYFNTPPDYEKAFKMASESLKHDSDNDTARFYLGRMYFAGYGIEKDHEKALSYLRPLADEDYGFMPSRITAFILEERGDASSVIHYYTKAADKGDTYSLQQLARFVAKQIIELEDGEKKIELIEILNELYSTLQKEDSDRFEAADYYYWAKYGDLDEQDPAKCAALWKKALDRAADESLTKAGIAMAHHSYADLIEDGWTGHKGDESAAYEHYLKAVELDPESLSNMWSVAASAYNIGRFDQAQKYFDAYINAGGQEKETAQKWFELASYRYGMKEKYPLPELAGVQVAGTTMNGLIIDLKATGKIISWKDYKERNKKFGFGNKIDFKSGYELSKETDAVYVANELLGLPVDNEYIFGFLEFKEGRDGLLKELIISILITDDKYCGGFGSGCAKKELNSIYEQYLEGLTKRLGVPDDWKRGRTEEQKHFRAWWDLGEPMSTLLQRGYAFGGWMSVSYYMIGAADLFAEEKEKPKSAVKM